MRGTPATRSRRRSCPPSRPGNMWAAMRPSATERARRTSTFGDRPGDGPGGARHLRSAVAGVRLPQNRPATERRKSPLAQNLLLHDGGAGEPPGRDGVLERCDGENHPPQRGYLGHMVQNKTGTVSYKNHKQVSKPESEWIRVENTHEPLISQMCGTRCSGWTTTRPEAQRQERQRFSVCRSAVHGLRGLHAVYAGLPEENQRQGAGVQGVCLQPVRFGRQRRLFFHYINQKALAHVVLLDIRSKSMWAQFGRAEIREKLLAQKESLAARKRKRSKQN